MESRKEQYALEKAKLTAEEVDHYFDKIDFFMANITKGSILYKKMYVNSMGKSCYILKPVKVASIVDKERGIISISYNEDEKEILEEECVLDLIYERYNIELCGEPHKLNNYPEYWDTTNTPVFLYFSDIVGFYYIEKNKLKDFKIAVLVDMNTRICELTIDTDISFAEKATEQIKDIFDNKMKELAMAICKRAQNLGDVVSAYMILCNKVRKELTNEENICCKDIWIPKILINKVPNVSNKYYHYSEGILELLKMIEQNGQYQGVFRLFDDVLKKRLFYDNSFRGYSIEDEMHIEEALLQAMKNRGLITDKKVKEEIHEYLHSYKTKGEETKHYYSKAAYFLDDYYENFTKKGNRIGDEAYRNI